MCTHTADNVLLPQFCPNFSILISRVAITLLFYAHLLMHASKISMPFLVEICHDTIRWIAFESEESIGNNGIKRWQRVVMRIPKTVSLDDTTSPSLLAQRVRKAAEILASVAGSNDVVVAKVTSRLISDAKTSIKKVTV